MRMLCQKLVDWDQQVILNLWNMFCTTFQEVSKTSFARSF